MTRQMSCRIQHGVRVRSDRRWTYLIQAMIVSRMLGGLVVSARRVEAVRGRDASLVALLYNVTS